VAAQQAGGPTGPLGKCQAAQSAPAASVRPITTRSEVLWSIYNLSIGGAEIEMGQWVMGKMGHHSWIREPFVTVGDPL